MMKTSKVLAVVAAATAVSGSVLGQVTITMPQSTSGSIPDYSQLGSPLSLSGSVSGLDANKTWYVHSVSLSLSGDPSGANGDIYAKLIYGNQASSILLNQPGTGTAFSNPVLGYPNNGLQFTFVNDQFAAAAGVTTDAHAYQTSPGYSADASTKAYGSYLVDGRETISTGTEPRTKLLSGFNGLAMNSSLWGLYLQDFSSGGKLKVDSWAITFTDVPEPSQYAMLAGLGLVGFAAYRRYRLKTA